MAAQTFSDSVSGAVQQCECDEGAPSSESVGDELLASGSSRRVALAAEVAPGPLLESLCTRKLNCIKFDTLVQWIYYKLAQAYKEYFSDIISDKM